MPPIWVGFWAENSPNQVSFFGRFSLNMGALSRNWRKMVKKLAVFLQIHHESGYDGKFW